MSSSVEKFKKLQVVQLSNDFRAATKLLSDASLPAEGPASGSVYVKVCYAGINASDINFTKGAYWGAQLPFDCGFEGLGLVVRCSSSYPSNGAGNDTTPTLKEGDAVIIHQSGAFAEYMQVPVAACTPVPSLDPAYLVLNVSGLTAAVSLGELIREDLEKDYTFPPTKSETETKRQKVALVTAAAGGTGQMAVQLLKQVYGCKVVGTCSSEEKCRFLQEELGCDVAINYKQDTGDQLDQRFSEAAPHGFDVIYECVGGELFNTAVRHIAVHGSVIIIGSITSYQDQSKAVGWSHPQQVPLSSLLLRQSASLKGFFLPNHYAVRPQYLQQLLELYHSGKLKAPVDHSKSFQGVEAVADAVDHLYSGTSYGKIVVRISAE